MHGSGHRGSEPALNPGTALKNVTSALAATALLATAFLGACSDSTAPAVRPDLIAANLGSMAVGDVRTLTLAQASGGLQIPASMASAQYLVVLGNADVAASTVPSFTVSGDWMTGPAVEPLASLGRGSAALDPGNPGPVLPYSTPRGVQFEAALRQFERTGLPHPDGGSSGNGAVRASLGGPVVVHAAAPAVGTTLSIKVLTPTGFNGKGSINCSAGGYTTTTGVVRAVGTYAIVVSDVTSPGGGFTDADFQAIADQFDTFTYPTDVAYFGAPTDLDNNGHIMIYYTPAVNKLTNAGQASVSGYVGGFFFAGDLYDPVAGSRGCLSSNKAEIFYLLAPDPSGTYGNRFSTQFVREVTSGTVSHELQHMINSGNRYVHNYKFEVTWLDEALAHFAESTVGRARAGFAPYRTVTATDIQALNVTQPSVASAYFDQNFARAKYYVDRPDTTGAIVSAARSAANLASRGAEWAFMQYLDDWFSGTDPHVLTTKLVAGPDTGTVNLVNSAGAPLDTLLSRWLVTLYTDHLNIQGLDPMYNYRSYNFRDIISRTPDGITPPPNYLPVKAIGNGRTSLSTSVPGSSASYFITSLSTGGARTVTVNNSAGAAATDPNGRVYVVRQR